MVLLYARNRGFAFDKISFENVVATGTILNEKGEKTFEIKKQFY